MCDLSEFVSIYIEQNSDPCACSSMPQNLPPHTTLTYKTIGDHTASLDVFPPIIRAITGNITPHYVPALVFFHGGGLTVGTRKSWFAHWLHSEMRAFVLEFIHSHKS